MSGRKIVAIGPAAQQEMQSLGAGFGRAWPIDDAPCFAELLEAIDDAERELGRDQEVSKPPGALIP